MLDFITSIAWYWWFIAFIVIVAIYDIFNKKHIVLRNFPVVGHIRYWLESIGPELRQYIVANNREELPFNRIERGWIYASAKNENNYEGFGTDRDIHSHNYIFINNAMMPFKVDEEHISRKRPEFLPCAKVIGASKNRKRPFRPASIINISAMSYGSLSARAIDAMNQGAKKIEVKLSQGAKPGKGGVLPAS